MLIMTFCFQLSRAEMNPFAVVLTVLIIAAATTAIAAMMTDRKVEAKFESRLSKNGLFDLKGNMKVD